jgi:bifunctional non-homologous end joining protein LigD
MTYRFGDITVETTNEDRVMWPAGGITKGELVAYYAAIAEHMVPELRGRPLTVERFTKGIDKGGFYQKHWQKHYPKWLDHGEVHGKTVVDYPIVDTPAGLVYLANQGSIAFHVFTSTKAALDRPDVVVFDLDPPDGRFDLAVRAARSVRVLLDALELPAFVKVTGSKGLHVVAPVDARDDFAAVHELCGRTAAVLCAREPDLFTVEFYKKDRKGRLFLDVMRNGLGATFVAAYSVRGRPGAPVSAPIEWDELDDPALAPDGFSLRDVPARVQKQGDPWATLRARAGSVSAALAVLDSLR